MSSPNKLTFEGKPKYGRDMTLEELEQFVADARRVGMADLVRVKVRASFGAGIRQLSASSEDVVKPRPEQP